MKFEPTKLKFSTMPVKEIKSRSKKFYGMIKKRRSIRDFSVEKFDDRIINNALKAAGTAPSGANLQPWHFVVIKNKKIKKQIRKAAEKEEKRFYNKNAPVEWLKALKPLGTDTNKKFLEDAPILIAVFEKKFTTSKNIKIKKLLCKRICWNSNWNINFSSSLLWLIYADAYAKSYDIFK